MKGNLLLQVGLIETLVLEHKDTDLAVYWAKRFAVPPEALPYAVVKRVDALRDIQYAPFYSPTFFPCINNHSQNNLHIFLNGCAKLPKRDLMWNFWDIPYTT